MEAVGESKGQKGRARRCLGLMLCFCFVSFNVFFVPYFFAQMGVCFFEGTLCGVI